MIPDRPINRLETYLARLAGQEVTIPDQPITRIECYLDYLCNTGGGGGDTPVAPGSGGHNSIFRGMNLGASPTDAQLEAIRAGTFEGLYVGDYWEAGGVKYRIAGFDIFLRLGATEFTTHHAVVVPDRALYVSKVNDTDDISTGYYGSALKTTGLDAALATFAGVFGDSHILSYPTLLSTSVSSGGVPQNYRWYWSRIDIMSGDQVMGTPAWATFAQNAINLGSNYTQFPMFKLKPDLIVTRGWYWLNDIFNLSTMTAISDSGVADKRTATTQLGVRPYICLGVD